MSGHHLGIGAADLDTGVQASTVMGINDIATIDFVSSNAAIVGSLWAGETILGPSQWSAIDVQKGVFLFNAEPWLFSGAFVHHFQAVLTVIALGGLAVVGIGFAQYQNVVLATEGILIDGNWMKVQVRVGTIGLIGGATIVIPNWQV